MAAGPLNSEGVLVVSSGRAKSKEDAKNRCWETMVLKLKELSPAPPLHMQPHMSGRGEFNRIKCGGRPRRSSLEEDMLSTKIEKDDYVSRLEFKMRKLNHLSAQYLVHHESKKFEAKWTMVARMFGNIFVIGEEKRTIREAKQSAAFYGEEVLEEILEEPLEKRSVEEINVESRSLNRKQLEGDEEPLEGKIKKEHYFCNFTPSGTIFIDFSYLKTLKKLGTNDGVGSVTLKLDDYKRLFVGKWLNDTLIEFLLKNFQFTQLSESDKNRCEHLDTTQKNLSMQIFRVYILPTHWFTKMTSNPRPEESKDPVQRR